MIQTAAAIKPPVEKKKPLIFKDAVGRKFSFPFHLCNTWLGMDDLIKRAFLHGEDIGRHVADGNYDLSGPNGEIIPPQVWETMVEPGWTITMHMWPHILPRPPPTPSMVVQRRGKAHRKNAATLPASSASPSRYTHSGKVQSPPQDAVQHNVEDIGRAVQPLAQQTRPTISDDVLLVRNKSFPTLNTAVHCTTLTGKNEAGAFQALEDITSHHNDLSPEKIDRLQVSQEGKLEKIYTRLPAGVTTALQALGLCESPLQRGKKRVRWRCRCGRQMYDDVRELRPGAAARYEAALNQRLKTQTDTAQSTEGGSKSLGDSVSSSLLGFASLFKHFRRSPTLPQYHQQSIKPEQTLQTSLQPTAEKLYLLLCIPHRRYATKLIHTDVCTFELYKSSLVDIHAHDSIPPESRKDEYRYRPIPAEIIPPVGENHLMHLFDHPEDADEETVCLEKFPKRLRERLSVCSNERTNIGWGIHFVEGLHWTKLWLFGLLGIIFSALFGVFWSVWEHDIQGGFAVAGCMMVFFTFTTDTVQAAFEFQ
ncbi:MAG: hypothetical protein M1830_008767 [Pleopsidium flavum]|nr:MAG: hypothetical protein M1830_008767 [Pleopsidium flavum]